MDNSYLFSNQSGLVLRRVKIPRSHNGFGFTLRHFIVYPPESYGNDGESSQNRRNQRKLVKVTEPVDTIFVKSIVLNGPADRAGLCVGDRIVSVNGETIFGKSYDQVVQLMQRTEDKLRLEVSPKQYDTLQLFFEETAYRPETNQRPTYASSGNSQPIYECNNKGGYYNTPPSSLHRYDRNNLSNNTSSDSFFLNFNHNNYSMSAPHPNSTSSNPQLFSHLSRPTPYKSSSVWSSLGTSQQPPRVTMPTSSAARQAANRNQTYYPFNQDIHPSQSYGASTLRKIKEEPNSGAKSAESILASGEGGIGDHYETSQRSGSMECLIGVSGNGHKLPSSNNWNNMGPGYRYSVAVDGNTIPNPSSHRRESTGSIPHANNAMVVTMSSTNSKIPGYYSRHDSSDSGTIADVPYSIDNGCLYDITGQEGYETKIVDRIKRSCEQKEEFLRRPNQPLVWSPQPSSSNVFPKELYAQPQKFEKIPWPPAQIVPTVTSTIPPLTQSSMASSSNSFDGAVKTMNNVSVVSVQHYPEYGYSRANSHDSQMNNVSQNRSTHIYNNSIPQQYDTRSISPSWLEYAPKNRTTIVGSRKLHCDPPPNWNPDLSSLTYDPTVEEDDEESGNFTRNETEVEGNWILDNKEVSKGYHSADYLSIARSERTRIDSRGKLGSHTFLSHPHLPVLNEGYIDTEGVILRRKELDPNDEDGDRLVRRVSYLKATSSPIDMDRKSSSPTSPTKSPTSEFRGFGTFRLEKSPDVSEVTREGQVHFKIRVGESKRGGYNRSWRQGWVQIRRSGCLYISKERLSKEAVIISDNSVIIALSLKNGVTVEEADYSKRKHVLKVKTSYTSEDIVPQLVTDISLYSSINANTIPSQHQPSHSTAVEIYIQTDDSQDFHQWLQSLHSQIENNNFCNGNSSTFKGIFFGTEFCPKQKSILTSLLPSPATAISMPGQSSQPSEKNGTNVVNNNSLHPSAIASVSSANSAASPKNKTWKGKVARQWKKVHNIIDTTGDSSKGHSPYNSLPPVGATFGIHLENCPPGERNGLVPRVIEYAIEVIESRGIDMVGLYRIPGNNASVATLTDRLNKAEDPNPEKDPRWLDVHVVASLIKSFLRRLPDPLLTDERYQAFIISAEETDSEKCCEKMHYLINDLPPHNYETLRAVLMHLKNVAEHGESNRMDIRNLAIVFGPTIVRTAEENVTNLVTDMKNKCKIVEILVSNADMLFKPSRRESCETSSPPDNLIPSEHGLCVQTNSESNSDPSISSVRPSLSPIPTIESEIKASVLQAAMRKASQKSQAKQAVQNVYGLPNKSPKRTKPIDDAGFIRSYAGLNEETEQRVKKFELETRAMLSREDRSPHSSAVNVGVGPVKPVKKMKDLSMNRLKLDDELQKAKDDLENEDIYDQLADNPSSIVQHRDRGLAMFPVTSGVRNLSNSSISSSNSNHTLPSSYPASLTINKKPNNLSESLPPKPPQSHSSGSSLIGPHQSKSSLSSSSSPVSPLRRVSSMDRIGTVEFDPTAATGTSSASKFFERNKIIDRRLGPLPRPFVPKHFGSLDSLKDIANGNNTDGTIVSSIGGGDGYDQYNDGGGRIGSRDDFSPRSSEGSDLVTSLSRTLDKKLRSLRRSHEHTGTAFSSLSSSNNMDSQDENENEDGIEKEVFDDKTRGIVQEITIATVEIDTQPKSLEMSTKTDNVKVTSASRNTTNGAANKSKSKRSWRRNSMIERRLRHEESHNEESPNINGSGEADRSYFNPTRVNGWSSNNYVPNGVDKILSKEAKTATNRFTRDCRRRHSLNGAGDILSLVFGSNKDRQYIRESNSDRPKQNNDSITTALSSAGILESHV